MFESSDDVGAIGAELVKIAVVQQNDFTARPTSRASRDGRQTRDQLLRPLRFPVVRGERPHHHAAQPGSACGVREAGPPISEGRPQPGWEAVRTAVERAGDTVLAARELLHDAMRGCQREVGVRFAVISDGVPASGDLADKFGARASELAHQKKCGAHISAFQKRQQARRDGGVWPVVEGQRDLRAKRRAAERGAK